MLDEDAVLFKSNRADRQTNLGLKTFSKMPVIRRFESLLTDDEFASVGLKIIADMNQKTYYISSAPDFVSVAEGDSFNTVTPGRYLLYHNFPSLVSFGAQARRPNLSSVDKRLNELRAFAEEDGIAINEQSAHEAMEWLRLTTPPVLPSVFLVNNGNVRLFWRSKDQQLGIQFVGDGTAQFVFLGEDDQTERIFGSVKVSELIKRLSGLDLCMILGFQDLEWHSATTKTSFVTSADPISKAMS